MPAAPAARDCPAQQHRKDQIDDTSPGPRQARHRGHGTGLRRPGVQRRLFPFGHGLSYTTFGYSGLRTSTATIANDGAVTASVTVTNTGEQAGAEVVRLYFRDPVASVTRPVRQLLGFARVQLEPGQAATVCFEIHTDRFAFVGASLDRMVEPGAIELYAGSSSTDIRSAARLKLRSPARTVRGKRRLVTSVRIQPDGRGP